jgi:uncharacterized paraquat-inducible protein A
MHAYFIVMKYCPNCGIQLTLGNEKFCPGCGHRLDQQVGEAAGNKSVSNLALFCIVLWVLSNNIDRIMLSSSMSNSTSEEYSLRGSGKYRLMR